LLLDQNLNLRCTIAIVSKVGSLLMERNQLMMRSLNFLSNYIESMIRQKQEDMVASL
jgi:hypothetical protein